MDSSTVNGLSYVVFSLLSLKLSIQLCLTHVSPSPIYTSWCRKGMLALNEMNPQGSCHMLVYMLRCYAIN